MTTSRPAVVLVTLAALGAAARALAAPGELDPAFGDNGFARIEAGWASRATAFFAQPDGKLLVGHSADGEALDFRVLRLDADGTRDPAFGTAGLTWLSISGASGRTLSVIQLRGGDVLVAGTVRRDNSAGTADLALVRYLADGRVDTGFGENGVARAGFVDAAINAAAVVEQSDGKLVASAGGVFPSSSCGGYGWCYKAAFEAKGTPAAASSSMALVRFDTAGAVDTGFGPGGRVLIDPSGNDESGIRWLTQQADGKLVAAGFIGPDMAVIRLTADGTLDPTFDGDGLVTVPTFAPAVTATAEAVAVHEDGKVVVAGTAHPCDRDDGACDSWAAVTVARLNSDGSLDASYGAGGRATWDIRGWERGEVARGGLVIEPDGAIVIGGLAGPGSAEASYPTYGFVARLTPAGELDAGFGADDGNTLLDVNKKGVPTAATRGIARLSSGAIAALLASNDPTMGLVVARLAPSGGNPGVLGLAQVEVTAREGADARFVVRRTGGASGAVGIDYWTYICWDWGGGCNDNADERDYGAASGTLTWADGDTSDRTVAIPIVADDLFENWETFSFELRNAAGGASVATSHGWVVITDVNDNPGTLQFVGEGAAVQESSSVVLWVSRTDGRTGALSVDYFTTPNTATAGLDFVTTTGTLEWADGDDSYRLIAIPIINDDLAEGDETFQVTLSAPSGGAMLGSASTATITLVDPSSTTSPPPVRSGGGGSSGVLDALLLALLFLASLAARAPHRFCGPKGPVSSNYTNTNYTNTGEPFMKRVRSLPSFFARGRLARSLLFGIAALTTSFVGSALATPSSGTTSTLVGRATFGEPFRVVRTLQDESIPPKRFWWDGKHLWLDKALTAFGRNPNHPDWAVAITAWPAVDVAVQTITFQPGAQSGWHTHPGPVFISVVQGTITFYDSDDPLCLPIVRHAGEGFLDTGEHAHIARNETGEPAVNVVTYFAPPGAAIRIDQPAPGTCGF